MYVVTCRRWFSVNQDRHSSTCFRFPAFSLCKNKNKTNCNPIKLNLERPHPLFLTYQKQRGSIQDLVLIRLDGSTLCIKWKVWSCVTHLKISQLKCQNFRNISTISHILNWKYLMYDWWCQLKNLVPHQFIQWIGVFYDSSMTSLGRRPTSNLFFTLQMCASAKVHNLTGRKLGYRELSKNN